MADNKDKQDNSRARSVSRDNEVNFLIRDLAGETGPYTPPDSGPGGTAINAKPRQMRTEEDWQQRRQDARKALGTISAGELGWGAVGAGGAGLLTWLLTGRRPGASMLSRALTTAGGAGMGFLAGMSLPSYIRDRGTGLTLAHRMRLADLVATTSADNSMNRRVFQNESLGHAPITTAPDRGWFDTVSDWLGRRRESRDDALSAGNAAQMAINAATGAGAAAWVNAKTRKLDRKRLDPDTGMQYAGRPDMRDEATAAWGANTIRQTVEDRNAALEALVNSHDRLARRNGTARFEDLSGAQREALLRSWHLPGGTQVMDGQGIPLKVVHGTRTDSKGKRHNMVWVDVDRASYSPDAMRNIGGVDAGTGRLDGKPWVSARVKAERAARRALYRKARGRSHWGATGVGLATSVLTNILSNAVMADEPSETDVVR